MRELFEKLLAEGTMSLSQAARKFRDSSGRALHPSTLSRWAKNGVKLANGAVLKLESARIAGKIVMSWQALMRFLEAQQPDALTLAVPGPRSPAQRQRDSERTAAELESIGVG